jgi:hypothetical protein
MIAPVILSWVKQSYQLAGYRIDAGKIGSFVKVAIGARPGKVLFGIRSAMLPGDDVLDMKRGYGEFAVLADSAGPASDQHFESVVHGFQAAGDCLLIEARARDCMMTSNSLKMM